MRTESDEQALCTSCGLCCDGSLFEFIPIEIAEQALFESWEIGLFPLNGGGLALPQPCHHLKNKCCDIYQAGRPSICGKYQCKLLKNFLRAEITYPAALEMIQATLLLRAELREKLEQQVGIYGLNLSELVKAWNERQPEETQTSGPVSELSLEVTALQLHLARNFKK